MENLLYGYIKNRFIYVIIFLLFLSFVNYNHYYPWTTYDSEKYVFYLSAFFVLYFISSNAIKVVLNTNLLLLLLLLLCSILSYPYYYVNQYFILFNIYLINLIILCVALCNFHDENGKLLDGILISLVLAGATSSILSIYQWMDFSTEFFWLYKSTGSRVSANLGQPNHLSTLLLLSVLSCIYFFNKFKIIPVLFFIPILVFSLVLTQSRSAMIALIIITTISCIKWRVLANSIKLILFSLNFLYIIMAHFLSKIYEKNDVIGRINGGFERLAIWQDFFNVLPHIGLFGVGWKNIEYYQFQYGENFSGYLSSYHNLLLDLIVVFGLFGAFFFIYIFIKLLLVFFRIENSNDLIIFLMLSVLINHSLFEFPLFYSYFLFVFCVLYFSLEKKYSRYFFYLKINKFIFYFISFLVIGLSFFYIQNFEKNRIFYRTLYLGYCAEVENKSIFFDEFENLAIINCKNNISVNNIYYFETALLRRPSSNNILKLIYFYHKIGEYEKRDSLLIKYNSRYIVQYSLDDVLKMKYYLK